MTKLYAIDLSTLPPEVADAIREMMATKTVTPKVKSMLRNRKVRHEGRFACERQPDPLWAAAIVWPIGVPTKGCGRTFASAAMRDAHQAGFTDVGRTKGWDPKVFPHGCLDRILPAEMRDTR